MPSQTAIFIGTSTSAFTFVLTGFSCDVICSKIIELEEELKVVGNNMKSLELSEQEVKSV